MEVLTQRVETVEKDVMLLRHQAVANDSAVAELKGVLLDIRDGLLGNPAHPEKVGVMLRIDRLEREVPDGLTTRLDRLEQTNNKIKWVIGVLATAVTGLITSYLEKLF